MNASLPAPLAALLSAEEPPPHAARDNTITDITKNTADLFKIEYISLSFLSSQQKNLCDMHKMSMHKSMYVVISLKYHFFVLKYLSFIEHYLHDIILKQPGRPYTFGVTGRTHARNGFKCP